jgi:hypothetical protein
MGGRPAVRLRDDDDRYYIALYEGLAVTGTRPNEAARIVAMFMAGEPFAMNDGALARLSNINATIIKDAYQKAVKDCPPGYTVVPFRKRNEGRFPAGFAGRIKGIQRKARDAEKHPDDKHWLYNMILAVAYAWCLPLTEMTRYLVFGHADIAGERDYAIRSLLPVVFSRTRGVDGLIPGR